MQEEYEQGLVLKSVDPEQMLRHLAANDFASTKRLLETEVVLTSPTSLWQPTLRMMRKPVEKMNYVNMQKKEVPIDDIYSFS